MTPVVLTMPDDPAAVPGWLERELVGPRLPQLAAELGVIHGAGNETDLDAVLGDRRVLVLARGLGAIPRRALTALLTSPPLLLELQALVFEHGGPYWDRLLAGPNAPVATGQYAAPRRRGPSLRWVSYVGVSFATAAAVLVAVYLGGGLRARPETPLAASGWGFARLKELPPDADRAAVLNQLADLAGEWEKKRPDDPVGLAKRLHEFREGCTALQLTDDLPLPDADRRWLAARCLVWSARFDAHLLELERTRDSTGVQAAATATARDIARELRDRAAG